MPNLLRDKILAIIKDRQAVAGEKITSRFMQIDDFYSGQFDELHLIRGWILNITHRVDLFEPELKILLQFLDDQANKIINSSIHSSYTEGSLFANLDLLDEFRKLAVTQPKPQRQVVVHICARR